MHDDDVIPGREAAARAGVEKGGLSRVGKGSARVGLSRKWATNANKGGGVVSGAGRSTITPQFY
jgi:hypothetical protein